MPRVIAILLALAGCAKTEDVYEITVALESNSCGPVAQPLPDGLTYRTQFEVDPPKATWKVLPKGAPITGSYNTEERRFRLTTSQTLNLDGIDAGAGQLACTVIRTETLTGTLRAEDAGVGGDSGQGDDPELTGEHVIGFTADPNGRCRGITGPLYPFDRIPCEAKYEITGVAKEDR